MNKRFVVTLVLLMLVFSVLACDLNGTPPESKEKYVGDELQKVYFVEFTLFCDTTIGAGLMVTNSYTNGSTTDSDSNVAGTMPQYIYDKYCVEDK